MHDSSLLRGRIQSEGHISSILFRQSSSGTSSSKTFYTPWSFSTRSKMLRMIFFPSRLSFLWNKQQCAIISLNVSSWLKHTVLMFSITVCTFFLIFLFLVRGAKQEHSISGTADKEPSEDNVDYRGDSGELKVDKYLRW